MTLCVDKSHHCERSRFGGGVRFARRYRYRKKRREEKGRGKGNEWEGRVKARLGMTVDGMTSGDRRAGGPKLSDPAFLEIVLHHLVQSVSPHRWQDGLFETRSSRTSRFGPGSGPGRPCYRSVLLISGWVYVPVRRPPVWVE